MGILGSMGGASELSIVLSLKDKASAKLKNFNKNVKSSNKAMLKMGLLAGAAVAAGIGAKAVKSAADFEKAMSNVSTLVDTNVESMQDMGKAVRELGKRVPVDLGTIPQALYNVRSAGIGAADAMDVLEQSAKLGVAGLGTTEEAVDLVTSSLNAFGLETSKSGETADTFFKAVKAGKTTISELAQGFGQVAPLANELGISFEELMANTSAMTTSGLKASIAYSQQRAVMGNLLKPTKEMQEIYDKLGITNIKNTIAADGFKETLVKLTEATGGNQEMTAKAFGSIEGLNAVMMLTGETGITATEILNGMTEGTNQVNEAFEKQNSTMSAQHLILKNKLNIALIELGNKIMPALIIIVDKLTWYVGEMQKGWETVSFAIRAIKTNIESLKMEFDLIIRKIKDFIEMVKKIPSGIGERISGIGGKIKGGLGFQHGGIVPGPLGSPVPAIVHGGETVIPAGKSFGGTVINITGNTFMSDEEAAEKIGDMIIENLKTQTRFML